MRSEVAPGFFSWEGYRSTRCPAVSIHIHTNCMRVTDPVVPRSGSCCAHVQVHCVFLRATSLAMEDEIVIAEPPSPPPDVVIRDCSILLGESEVCEQLRNQGFAVSAVVRFRRTAKGKPPKLLPMCRVQLSDTAAAERLIAAGATIAGVRCPAERAQVAADSASAAGWQAAAGAEGVWRIRTAVEAVAPLQGVPYDEQLRRKRASVLEELKKLPGAMRQLLGRSGDALPWLLPEALREDEGSPCPIETVVPSPLELGYRNKAEFSIGHDANGIPCVGFVLGHIRRQTQAVAIGEVSGCRLLSAEMRAAVMCAPRSFRLLDDAHTLVAALTSSRRDLA